MYRTRVVSVCALVLMLSSLSLAQGTPVVFDKSKLPETGRSAADFVPAGWVLEEQIAGDLNGDAVPDLALKLVQEKPAGAKEDEIVERQRALVVLFKGQDGGLRRAGVADKVLQCTACGGAFYGVVESPAEVKIERGVIVVNQDFGSREVTEHTYRFRYDPAAGRIVLIGFDSTSRDRLTGTITQESTNYLTGRKITTTTTPPRTRRGKDTVKTTTQAVARKRTPMEEVDRENFY
ncbi:MAG TPA: hypothetical protein VK421_17160 [Pyrinomonadaceae bacterium]|nr:hypothetical protein [Pyrinomonadaceae bacterium]